MRMRRILCCLASLYGFAQQGLNPEIYDLSLEDLLKVEIISATKHPQKRDHTPGAVYLLTQKEIFASGVQTLPEALRLIPGVEVAQNGSHSWAISMRGFNSTTSNKLLVLIDGRSIYTPLYSGVFWEMHSVLMEDIDRIEVIGGPGGTVWGANAVNGIINVITHSPEKTQKGFLKLLGGSELEASAGFRYGGKTQNGSLFSGFANWESWDDAKQNGSPLNDSWERLVYGGSFMKEKGPRQIQLSLHGFYGKLDDIGNQITFSPFSFGTTSVIDAVSGQSLNYQYKHQFGDGDMLTIEGWLEHSHRDIPLSYSERRDTLSVELRFFQQNLGPFRDVTSGVNGRITKDTVGNSFSVNFEPEEKELEFAGAYWQGAFPLESGEILIGNKIEYNSYTQWENMPNIRVLLGNEGINGWAAISRAVRVPSRLDADLQLRVPVPTMTGNLPTVYLVSGKKEVDAEELVAYELGFRWHQIPSLAVDLAFFNNEYEELQTVEIQNPELRSDLGFPYVAIPSILGNKMVGTGRGGTLDLQFQPSPDLNIRGSFTHLSLDLNLAETSSDISSTKAEGYSPSSQGFLSAIWTRGSAKVFLSYRYVGKLEQRNVPAYHSFSTTFSYTWRSGLTLSLIGQNLGDSSHKEFSQSEIERNIMGRLVFRF